jgi:hypothetical protein
MKTTALTVILPIALLVALIGMPYQTAAAAQANTTFVVG